MYYIVCPTCRFLIAQNFIPYEEEVKKLMQDKNIHDLVHDHEFNEKRGKIVMKYFDNLCCRAYILGAADVAELIQ